MTSEPVSAKDLGFETHTIATVSELTEALIDLGTTDTVWFRGHRDATWELLPSLIRVGGLEQEHGLMRRFKQEAGPLLPARPATEWDWMFLMQHHSVPTRLLDWSESPLVALYFAMIQSSAEGEADACVWAMRPQKLNELGGIRVKDGWDVQMLGENPELEKYLPSQVNLYQNTILTPVAAIADRQFPRVVAQQGVFTIAHRDTTPLEQLGSGDHVRKFVIPAQHLERIRRELLALRITELSLFPELQKVGEQVARYL